MPLADAGWRRRDLPVGLAALARLGGLVSAGLQAPAGPEVDDERIAADNVVRRRAEALGLRAEAVGTDYSGLAAMLCDAAPAVVRIEVGGEERFLLLAGGRGSRLKLLGPDLALRWTPAEALVAHMIAPLAATLPTDIDGCIADAGIPPRRRRKARDAMLDACTRGVPVEGTWLLRPSRTVAWWQSLRRDGLVSRTLLFALAHAGQILVALLAWGIVARLTFTGDRAPAWLWALLLALLTMIPFQVLGGWIAGLVALDFGVRLKQRLLVGALNLSFQEVRADGVGRHFSRVVESEAFEALLLSGAAGGVTALLELAAACMGLALAGSVLASMLLIVWTGLLVAVFLGYLRARRRWARQRLTMTQTLVESLVGHQTRLAQEAEAAWHQREDAGLAAYQACGAIMDRWQVLLSAFIVRGWFPVGIAGLVPVFMMGRDTEVSLAVSLGAVLLAQRAFTQVAASARALGEARIAWQLVEPLFAAARSDEAGKGSARAQDLLDPVRAPVRADTAPLLEVQNLGFGYGARGVATLANVTCAVRRGDRILLEGQSGNGKSTLAALLAGLYRANSGLILLRGLDYASLGAAEWRRRVVLAPQFHDNHIFSGTLAYNLLLGGRWPPSRADLAEAEALCRELELGSLLDRMPNGLQQVVGETGWQLSHGERSRVFLTRALLQNAEVLILDESFSSLDCEKMLVCLETLLVHQNTFIMIAHS